MLNNTLVFLVLAVALAGCTKKSKQGETCSASGDCEGELRCDDGKCANPVILKAQRPIAAVIFFYVDHGTYPTQSEGFRAVMAAYPELKAEDIKDPWGNDFDYQNPPRSGTAQFSVVSRGPDGKAHTGDDIEVPGESTALEKDALFGPKAKRALRNRGF